jgi:hypothetical protein
MSEYQYYEFQALDRPLTQAQMDELRSHSSRARITPTRFVNEYNWGSFKGDPVKWMEKYFDAFLYVANWGSRRFMLRVPKRLLDPKIVSQYCAGESISFHTKGEHIILSFDAEDEDGEWEDGEGWLASLAALRSDLMRGDYRCLYLGWLLALQACELDSDTIEPPVPSGLGELSAPLRGLADFLRIDSDLIAVAAECSDERSAPTLSRADLAGWVAKLPSQEKDTVIAALLKGEDLHVGDELRQRAMREIRGGAKSGRNAKENERRRVMQLADRAESIAGERRQRETEKWARENAKREREQAEKRKKHLESLIGKENALWSKIDALIATKQPKRYDEAVLLLHDLHEVAAMTGQRSAFSSRMEVLYREQTRKPSLLDRFRKANLMG